MENKNTQNIINVAEILDVIKHNFGLYAKVLLLTFVAACAWIFPQPRYYTTSVVLAPEMNGGESEGSLSSIASSFGFNMSGLMSSDAIYPTLYPDLMSSPNFLVTLFDVEVETEKGDLKCDFYTYMTKHQKNSFWLYPKRKLSEFIRQMTEETKPTDDIINKTDNGTPDVFNLSKKQLRLIEKLTENIKCSVDKKTDVITITVTDQDRKISALMADSIRVKLQEQITDYRTKKARQDAIYYEQLTENAKKEFEDARKKYAHFADTHNNIGLASYKTQLDDLENAMSLKYNTYSTLETRLQASYAKIQERTPAFTIIKGATMARKPAGPKRMIFVAGMLILAFVSTTLYKLRQKKQETAC